MTELPELLGKAAFARFINRQASYVTALLNDGRLVMEGQGIHAKVRVRESLARMAATKGAREDVAARWAEMAGSAVPEASAPAGAPPAGSGEAGDVVSDLREERARAELRKTRAQAEQEEMASAKMRGELIARDDVDAAMRALGAAIRAAADVLPDQVAPVVAPVTALDECHALLTDAKNNLLERFDQEVRRRQEELAKGVKP